MVTISETNRIQLRGVRGGYAVFWGQKVMTEGMPKRQAEARREELIRELTRPCLSCGKPFLSEGSHRRMCQTCRTGKASMFHDGAV